MSTAHTAQSSVHCGTCTYNTGTVPQWTDDWAVCAVDIPDAQCHWYVQQADNTFGEGFDWENAPWFDVNGLNDVPAIQASTAVQKLQERK